MSEHSNDEFFVGYLPLPPRTKHFVTRAALLMLTAFLLAGSAIAGYHIAPAPTDAHPGARLVGLIDAQAYGVLWDVSNAQGPRPVLLSRGGKFGAPDAVQALHGKLVELQGLLLERDGYRLLEVSKIDEHPALGQADRARLLHIPRRELGSHTLRGEIVDIKCWLGRMKPGEGRTHRACAQFCIAGGIPPVLVARDEAGREQRYVLTDHAGAPVNEAVLPYVAEPVELTGELSRQGELLFLRIDPAHIRRL